MREDAGAPHTDHPALPPRTVQLPDGRSLVVREADAADVAGVVALFERLGPEDRHRRFFSGFHPDAAFVSALVERPPAAGRILVAELSTSSGSELVAEAEYAVLADGDAELAMTVDRRWRGWLAPFLLDALVEVAAAAGIPNLRAEVLVQNRPMLALLRARGCAAVETGDPAVVNLVIGTGGSVPCWAPGAAHPRVLLEAPGSRWRLTTALQHAGVQLLRCSGPANRPAGAPCPLTQGGSCPLVAGADVVIHALPDDGDGGAVLTGHRRSPVPVIEATGGSADDADDVVSRVLGAAEPG